MGNPAIGSEGRQKPIIVWVEYPQEGWHPHGFDTSQEASDWLVNEAPEGRKVVTRRLQVKVEP